MGMKQSPLVKKLAEKAWVVEDQCLNWCMKLVQILPDESIDLNS